MGEAEVQNEKFWFLIEGLTEPASVDTNRLKATSQDQHDGLR
jgi:hypothetical protein